MAIVIRSNREFEYIPKNKSELGPGEYEKEFFNNNQNYQYNNIIPFNSKIEKNTYDYIKINNELGPGEYYKENQNSFIKKSFNKNSIEDIKEKNKYDISLFNLMNKEKYQKLKERKTLIIDKQNSNQVKNFRKKINYKINKAYPKQYIKLIPTTLTKNRIKSIPSKEYYLGYSYDENKKPLMIGKSFDNNNKKYNTKNIKDKIINNLIKKNNSYDLSKNPKKDINTINNILHSYIDKETKKENSKNKIFNNTINNYTNVNKTNYSLIMKY